CFELMRKACDREDALGPNPDWHRTGDAFATRTATRASHSVPYYRANEAEKARTQFSVPESQRAGRQTAKTRPNRDPRPILLGLWSTTSRRFIRNDGRLRRFPEVCGRLLPSHATKSSARHH